MKTNQLPLSISKVSDYIFFYFFNHSSLNSKANELSKNPFRPMRKGINSMIRLHSTGALAMPVEVRLQILASSRDVIHS